MLPILVFLAVVAGLVVRKLTPEERIQLVHKALDFTRTAVALVRRYAGTPPGCEDFYAALRERTRRTFVTPALIAAYVTIFIVMMWGDSSLNDALLLRWGGSIGPRTTNGEWWRLATAMFLHWGMLHLIADVVGLVQVGRLVERLVGQATFAVVFVAAGLIAGLQELSVHPVTVSVGASGGIFGVYGLLLGTIVWGRVRRSALTVPIGALTRVLPGAVVFLVYHAAAEGFVTESMKWGLSVGFAGGGILAFGIGSYKPPIRRLCTSMAATLALVIIFAAPLRGMADITREMAHVIDLETRTAAAYDAEVRRFRKGHQTAEALADMAEAIGADIHKTRESLALITNVPRAHQPILDDALEYLRLREESWRLRVEGLRGGRLQTLQRAEAVERKAKESFAEVEKLKNGKVE